MGHHTISILVLNQSGVLVRVAGMFSRRGFNIESLAVGTTHVPEYSRITAVMQGSDAIVKQVVKQLEKLVEVRAVEILPVNIAVVRDMAMIKVRAGKEKNLEVLQLAESFGAKVVDISEQSLIVEITSGKTNADALIAALSPYGIIEMIRAGVVGLQRGDCSIYEKEKCEVSELFDTSPAEL
ncbi:acetolactate synthase small subunit [Pelosinus sp. IPA-1]|uniref:acetolactate synthase small subunit n=1 Tax=Pelosinus sp. IPA-1 TaxID=3029569 RepID=UPI0024362594|nr:acetolactate synthase small subunit [Pelosinus sp. IPA-1]GMB01358.1 acetolactate synthase small subunit [Pelosinus sp. IPA-1]